MRVSTANLGSQGNSFLSHGVFQFQRESTFRWTGLLRFLSILTAFFAISGYTRAQDVTTWHYDNARSGVQSHETTLTPSNVTSSSFGKVFSLPVIGDIYAQPLYLSQ